MRGIGEPADEDVARVATSGRPPVAMRAAAMRGKAISGVIAVTVLVRALPISMLTRGSAGGTSAARRPAIARAPAGNGPPARDPAAALSSLPECRAR